MKILALSGKRCSGKSTAAKFLAEEYGAVRVGFADAIRHELCAVLGYPREFIYGKPTHPRARALMISHGQARRWITPTYWITKLMAELAHQKEVGTPLVVIDDLRFWNEAETLMGHGAELVRVMRPGLGEPFIRGVDDDKSETDLDWWEDWDAVIKADHGDTVELCRQAVEVLKGAQE